MKTLITIAAFLVGLNASAQNQEVYYDNGNVKESAEKISVNEYKVTTFFESGTIKSERYVKDGLRSGTWKAYNEEGNIVAIRNYQEGKRTGNWTYIPANNQNKIEVAYTAAGTIKRKEVIDPYGNKVASK